MSESTATYEGKPDEIVVFMIRRDTQCAECGDELGRGRLLRVENGKGAVPGMRGPGSPGVPAAGATRPSRAGRAATRNLRAVVVEWSRTRKRATNGKEFWPSPRPSSVRKRNPWRTPRPVPAASNGRPCGAKPTTRTTSRLSPVPSERSIQGARPARSSRSPSTPAANTAVASAGPRRRRSSMPTPSAWRLFAHLRHVHTNYDQLLCRLGDRQLARQAIQGQVATLLRRWESPE